MSDPNFFLSRLNGEPHALAFGGQSTPWPVALADLTNDPALEATLRGHVAAANTMLAPVAADLLATTGRAVDLFGFKPNPARLGAAAAATVSVEGIALTQLGALIDAAGLGLDVANTAPVAVLGHSQGVLGAHMVNVIRKAGSIEAAGRQIDEILAIAELIGVEAFYKLAKEFGGATLYIPKPESLIRPVRDAKIKEEFNGYNHPALGQEVRGHRALGAPDLRRGQF